MSRRVIVVGGGPAGLTAAEAALRLGARVTLYEAGPRLGGQFWRHPDPRLGDGGPLQHHWSWFTRLRQVIMDHPFAEVITDAQVWAIDHVRRAAGPAGDRRLQRPRLQIAVGSVDGPDRQLISDSADALVLATGAHDLTLPFPGWELPGVFTGGAAQTLAKAEQVAVGRRVVVAGAGPFLLPVATSLAAVGATVLGVYEAATVRRLSGGWLPQAPWLVGKGPELGGYLARLAALRIPYRPGRAVIRAHGDDRLTGVTIARLDDSWRPVPGTERRIAADAVCVSHGFTPRLELAIAAGCAITPDRFVEVDAGQRTSVAGVFAAGETTGIGGSDAALAEGTIAGHLAAGGSLDDAALRSARRARRQLDHLAAAVRGAHRIGRGWTDWLSDDTMICRCEEVSYRRLRETLQATGSRGLRALKLTTRIGLGPCQGRICGRTAEALITADGSTPVTDAVQLERRPIAVPIRFGELATAAPPPSPPADTTDEPTDEGITR